MAGEPPIPFDDLRAGVSAGLISEAQAADLAALSRARAAGAEADDERFELFRGFNEVFVTVGIAMLTWGFWLILAEDSATGMAAVAVIAWLLAEYFTRRRRMILPSIALSLVFTGAALLFFLRFRLPFALFPAGLLALAAAQTFAGAVDGGIIDIVSSRGWPAFLDLSAGGPFALVTLIFGLFIFALAMSFDLRDPHRVTSRAACGFWLHILAGPAIVNTAAFTFRGMESGFGGPLLTAFMVLMALVAVVIDRRSFLIAASGYLAAIVANAVSTLSTASTMILLGIGILILGAGWTGIRGRVMRALPDFPGKDRLPPYRKAEA